MFLVMVIIIKKISALLRYASEGKSFILKDKVFLTCPVHQNPKNLMHAGKVS